MKWKQKEKKNQQQNERKKNEPTNKIQPTISGSGNYVEIIIQYRLLDGILDASLPLTSFNYNL